MPEEIPTDAYGDSMTFVESYGGYLPKSDNIPTARTQYNVSGITHDGAIYCVDCAFDMGLIEVDDGELVALVDGKQTPIRKAPWTGVVLPSHETMVQDHCSRHSDCINAVDGKNHPYNHTHSIGIGIKQKVLEH